MGRFSTRTESNEVTIKFPKFHAVQQAMYNARTDREVWRCGRRFGKTTLLEEAHANWAIKGEKIGWFSPNYKLLLPSYKRMLHRVAPLVSAASRIDGIIELRTGGSIEFWTLGDPDAGRSRAYHRVAVDEAGLVLKGLGDIWDQSIEPTLLDYGGSAIMAGTPKGEDPDNYFYRICKEKNLGWNEVHAPTKANPFMNAEAIEKLRKTKAPLVFQQEYEAEFVNWNGVQFFQLAHLLGEDGNPIPYPTRCDAVYAVIDTALKTGSDNDGTAVTFYAIDKRQKNKLVILDWDVTQIQGDLLIEWLPQIYERLDRFANICGARTGNLGPFIEDKGSGTILLQQAERRGWLATPIESTLTSVGKDERALSVSGYVYNGDVKLSNFSYDKVTEYKQQTRNHFMTQVLGFRIGDKEAAKRADDLLDTFTYGVAIGLGDASGY